MDVWRPLLNPPHSLPLYLVNTATKQPSNRSSAVPVPMRFLAALGALCALAVASLPTHAVPAIETLLHAPLPFATQSHTFALSESLFSGTGGATADAPFPTGAFWTNLVLEQGEAAVATLPYALRLLRGRVHVSHPFRVVMPQIIQNGFLSQLVLSSAGADGSSDASGLSHNVIAFDALSATVRFSRRQETEFTLLLVRGSPYITAEYTTAHPTLEGFEGITIARIKKLSDQVFANGDAVDFAVFLVQLNTGQTWGVYASDPLLELTLRTDGRVTSTAPFTGTLRVALCLDSAAQPLLLEAAPFYPVGGVVDYDASVETDVATIEFRWQTRRFQAAPTANVTDVNALVDSDKLLMLALPHHSDLLAAHSAAGATPLNALASELRYTSIKGVMTGVYGSVWRLRETLPAVEWDFAADGTFAPAQDQATRDSVTAAIVAQLAQDAAAFPELPVDSYNFGKQIAREARLLLIAERFAQPAVAAQLLQKLETALTAWLTGTNADFLVYDQTFGGVVTRNGLRDQDADYGNGRYNDHHVRVSLCVVVPGWVVR